MDDVSFFFCQPVLSLASCLTCVCKIHCPSKEEWFPSLIIFEEISQFQKAAEREKSHVQSNGLVLGFACA